MICNVCGRHIHYCECDENKHKEKIKWVRPKIVRKCIWCKKPMGSSTNKWGSKNVHKKCEKEYVQSKGLLY